MDIDIIKRNYITIAQNVTEEHRCKIILHENYRWYFGEFDSIDQLNFFAKTVGFKIHYVDMIKYRGATGMVARFTLDRQFVEEGYFWNLNQIPDGAKPIKALCNGSIVTCYYLNDGKNIHWYRPNPNAKNVYKPLNIEEHIKHSMIYGSY